MNEFEVYLFYNALNLHYKSKTFDFFKTGIYSDKLKWTPESYQKKPEYLKGIFRNISQMREPKLFMTGNIIFNPSKFIRDFEPQYHLKFRKLISNYEYLFKEEIKKINFDGIENNHRELIGLYLNDEISLMTICNVDLILDVLKDGDRITKDLVFFVKKSQGFFKNQFDSCLKILYNHNG